MYAQHNPSLIHICSAFDTQIILTHCQHISEVYPTLISCVYQIMLYIYYIYIICSLLSKGCVWVCLRMWYQKKTICVLYIETAIWSFGGIYHFQTYSYCIWHRHASGSHLARIEHLNLKLGVGVGPSAPYCRAGGWGGSWHCSSKRWVESWKVLERSWKASVASGININNL